MKLMRWVAAGSSLGLLALLSGCGSTPPATPPATPVSSTLAHPAASTPNASSEEVVRGPLGRQLDEALSRYESYGLSGSFLVEHAGELVLHKGYGLCDPARALPCRPDTLFDVGSISKQFTATAILRLEDEGKLSVNDELGRHIPELGPELAQLTLHQLLTHSSGLDEDISRYAAGDREAFLRAVGGHPHAGSPGGQFIYSNAGYSLLAEVVQRAAGRDYETFMRELVGRAGLRSTRFVPQNVPPPLEAAKPQRGSPGELTPAPRIPWYVRGAGGVHTTLPDLLEWLHALDGELLSPRAREQLFTPALEGYAYGWHIDQTPLGVVRWHGGAIFGQHAMLRRYVQDDVIVIHVINQQSGWGRVVDSLFDDLIGERARPLPPPAIVSDRRAERFVGRYRLAEGGRLRLRQAAGGLIAEALDDESYALIARPSDHEGWLQIAPHVTRAREHTRQALAWLETRDLSHIGAALPPKTNHSAQEIARRWRATVLATGSRADAPPVFRLLGTLPLPHAARVVVAIDGALDSRYVALDWSGATLVAMTVLAPMEPTSLAVTTGPREVSWLARDGSFVRAELDDQRLLLRLPGSSAPLIASRDDGGPGGRAGTAGP